MYARVFSGQLQPEKIEEANRLVQESIIPVAQQQPGFQKLLWLVDPTKNTGMIISLWATAADRTASENNGFLRAQLIKLATVVVGQPTVEHFVVSSEG